MMFSNPIDTPEITALIGRYERTERAIQKFREVNRKREREIDEIRLALRPTYPSPDQEEALAIAAEAIHTGINKGDHLGYSVGDRVAVDGKRGWVHVGDRAPYSATGGRRLWDYTDEEIEAFIAFMTGLDLVLTDKWRSDGGVSFVFRSTIGAAA